MLRAQSASQKALRSYLPPDHGHFDMAQVFWAMCEHYHWFFRERPRADKPFRLPDWYPPGDAYAHSESGEDQDEGGAP